jgi:beta-aspartyl-peptidase (threonine type)
MTNRNVLILHGGAGDWEKERLKKAERALRNIGERAYEVLLKKGAVEAVTLAINMLEDSEIFNAGYGSALNLYGEVQVDASIMLGDGKAGAIASISGVKYAVSLARIVMEQTDHVLLTSPMADHLAEINKLKVDSRSLISEYRLKQWERAVGQLIRLIEGKQPIEGKISNYIKRVQPKLIHFLTVRREVYENVKRKFNRDGNTVGAVAFDGEILVAATSTGGTFLKLPGRIGDTPLIGAGTYADNESAAVSATGIGEHIIKTSLSYSASREIKLHGIKKGVVSVFKKHFIKPDAGIIGIDKYGNWGIAHTTKYMPCVVITEDEVIVDSVWIKV